MTEVSACGWDVRIDDEFKRVPKLKSSEVDGIIEWASKQPHLPQIPKHRVVMFLRACDFSLERTKDTIELFYTIRTKVPEIFSNLDVDSYWVQTSLKNIYVGAMPTKDEEDNFYVYYKLRPDCTMNEWKFDEYAKTVLMSIELTHLTQGSGDGYHFIGDVKYFGLSHLLQTPVSAVQHILKFVQDASHCKIKSLHFVNGGAAFERLYLLAKPFINKNVEELIHIHAGTDTLFKAVNEKFIPSDYGGSGPSLKDLHAKNGELLKQKNEWFKTDCLLSVEESKRPPTSKCEYGIVGSFRKIAID